MTPAVAWFQRPHHPKATLEAYRVVCNCRTPAPGMSHQACARFPIDLARSFTIGHKPLGVGMHAAAGVPGVLVRTRDGADAERAHPNGVPGAGAMADDPAAACQWPLTRTPSAPVPAP